GVGALPPPPMPQQRSAERSETGRSGSAPRPSPRTPDAVIRGRHRDRLSRVESCHYPAIGSGPGRAIIPAVCQSGVGMRRRNFVTVRGGAAAYPFSAGAQQKAMPVVGFLSSFSPPTNLDDRVRGPIHEGMGEMGFVEGQNMVWEYRWADGRYDRLPALAADL